MVNYWSNYCHYQKKTPNVLGRRLDDCIGQLILPRIFILLIMNSFGYKGVLLSVLLCINNPMTIMTSECCVFSRYNS